MKKDGSSAVHRIPIEETEGSRSLRRADDYCTPEIAVRNLRKIQVEHPIWKNPLLRACRAGNLERRDFQFIFGQYYHYSSNFTRYLGGLMCTLENDAFRAKLTANLADEASSQDPEQRHSKLFRDFLGDGLGIDVDAIEFTGETRQFVREYLDFSSRSNQIAATAFLSLGTEEVVPRLYGMFLEGLRKAGIPERTLKFFKVHVVCDDEHAADIEDMMISFFDEPGWYEICQRAIKHALDCRDRFLTSLFNSVRNNRVGEILDRIQDKKSLAGECDELVHNCFEGGEPYYSNSNPRRGIEFEVDRLPFRPQVLDPRILRIPPGKTNELHKHAHESIFYILEGTGQVRVDKNTVDVRPGDAVFVPRWCLHQSINNGEEQLKILAVTDYELTTEAFVGNYLRTARQKKRGERWGLTGVLVDNDND